MAKVKSQDAAAVYVNPSTLTAWDQNPRDNSDAISKVADSINRWGFASPIVARSQDGRVIAGHTRLAAALSLGLDSVPVRFMDLDEQSANALALADNRLGEVADWDVDTLTDILQSLQEDGVDLDGLGWEGSELDDLLQSIDPILPDGSEDDVPDLQEGEADSQPGQVYQLGPHRLICGDSTDPDIWEKLMDGERAKCVWTDPPYGIAYVGGTDEKLTILNDDLDEHQLYNLLAQSLGNACNHCESGASWYVASPPGPLFYQFATVLSELEIWKHTLVWAKDRLVLGRSDYHYRHEAIFYGWKPGAAHYFVDDRTKTTLLEFDRPTRSKEHPTMKPVALVASMIENSTKPGWIVAEPFGGSGTTLLACATLGRRARLIELDPKYCDVIRRRWTQYAKQNGVEVGEGYLDG